MLAMRSGTGMCSSQGGRAVCAQKDETVGAAIEAIVT